MPHTKYGARSTVQHSLGDCSKITIAVNEDIDADSGRIALGDVLSDKPVKDIKTLDYRGQGHGPKREHGGEEDSTLLSATMKSPMPPLALPGKDTCPTPRNLGRNGTSKTECTDAVAWLFSRCCTKSGMKLVTVPQLETI